MSTGPWAFKQRDVDRLIRAMTKRGLQVTGVRVHKDGAIEVVTGGALTQDSDDQGANEWDSLKAQ
jgi:hypothetical protein